jgi:hypothetical protein
MSDTKMFYKSSNTLEEEEPLLLCDHDLETTGTADMSKEFGEHTQTKVSSDNGAQASSTLTATRIGRENLSDALPPHESYEGLHRYDPGATWTEAKERKVVRKTDLILLSWLCVMVCSPVRLNTYMFHLTPPPVLRSPTRPWQSLKCNRRQPFGGFGSDDRRLQ